MRRALDASALFLMKESRDRKRAAPLHAQRYEGATRSVRDHVHTAGERRAAQGARATLDDRIFGQSRNMPRSNLVTAACAARIPNLD
jgi:hypothetical protein